MRQYDPVMSYFKIRGKIGHHFGTCPKFNFTPPPFRQPYPHYKKCTQVTDKGADSEPCLSTRLALSYAALKVQTHLCLPSTNRSEGEGGGEGEEYIYGKTELDQ